MQDPLFRARVDDAKRDVVSRTSASVADAISAVIATLKAMLASRDEWVRLRAAKQLDEMAARYREFDLTERVLALEGELERERKAWSHDRR